MTEIKFNVLIAEDEENIGNFISAILKTNGYKPIIATTGNQAIQCAESYCPDVILLDLGLPDMDGIDVISEIRKWAVTPIIVISARNRESEKVKALDAGADDYITKPFNPLELIARVKSQLRRYTQLGSAAPAASEHIYTTGGLTVNDDKKEVLVDGEAVRMTPIEYNILLLLMKNPGRVFSTTQIYESIWNEEAIGADNTVAVHIRHIREKIEINPKEPRYLKVVWGLGYKVEKI